jgi:hypothetical protein
MVQEYNENTKALDVDATSVGNLSALEPSEAERADKNSSKKNTLPEGWKKWTEWIDRDTLQDRYNLLITNKIRPPLGVLLTESKFGLQWLSKNVNTLDPSPQGIDMESLSITIGNMASFLDSIDVTSTDNVADQLSEYHPSTVWAFGCYIDRAKQVTEGWSGIENIELKRRLEAIVRYFDKEMELVFNAINREVSAEENRLARVNNKILQALGFSVRDIKEAHSSLKDIEKTAGQIRLVAAGTGASAYSKLFDDESKIHLNEARHWRIVILVVAILITFAAVCLVGAETYDWLYTIRNLTAPAALIIIGPKIVIISIAFYILVFAARNHRLSKQNYVENKQKSISVLTLELFLKAAPGEDAKTAILHKVLDSILSSKATGYSDAKQEEGDAAKPLAASVDSLLSIIKQAK